MTMKKPEIEAAMRLKKLRTSQSYMFSAGSNVPYERKNA